MSNAENEEIVLRIPLKKDERERISSAGSSNDDNNDRYYSDEDDESENEKEPVEEEVVKEDVSNQRTMMRFNFGHATPKPQSKAPTPKPETPVNVTDSHVSLSVEEKKLKLRKSNVISIVNDLIYLLENSGSNSDVEFMLVRREDKIKESIPSKIKPFYAFHLHSLVLSARSSWCRNLLEKQESVDGKFPKTNIAYEYQFINNKHYFKLENVHVDVFQEFVKFLYIAQCKVTLDNHIGLIQLARSFNVKKLEELVCRYIKSVLIQYGESKKPSRINDLLNLAKVAYNFELEEIKVLTVDLLSGLSKDIIQTEAWETFAIKYPQIVSDMLAR